MESLDHTTSPRAIESGDGETFHRRKTVHTFAGLFSFSQAISLCLLLVALVSKSWREGHHSNDPKEDFCEADAGLFNSCQELMCNKSLRTCGKNVVIGLLVAALLFKCASFAAAIKVVQRGATDFKLAASVAGATLVNTALSIAGIAVFSGDFSNAVSGGIHGFCFSLAIASTVLSAFAFVQSMFFAWNVARLRRFVTSPTACDPRHNAVFIVQQRSGSGDEAHQRYLAAPNPNNFTSPPWTVGPVTGATEWGSWKLGGFLAPPSYEEAAAANRLRPR